MNPRADARPPLPGLRLPLPSRGVAPGAVAAVLVHAGVIGALVIQAGAPAGGAPRPAKLLFIKAAPNRKYLDVMQAMDIAHGAGVQVIGFTPPEPAKK